MGTSGKSEGRFLSQCHRTVFYSTVPRVSGVSPCPAELGMQGLEATEEKQGQERKTEEEEKEETESPDLELHTDRHPHSSFLPVSLYTVCLFP